MAIPSKANPEMKKQDLQFQVEQLRMQSSSCATEGILVAVLSILTAVFLPEMILRVILSKNANLTSPPEILTFLPYIAYGVGMLYGIWVLVLNNLRSKKAKALMDEMLSMKQ